MLHNSISSHHRRDNTMATLLSSIVVVFLCCHSTKLVTNTYEAYQMIYYGQLLTWPPWAEILSRWNHFMLAVNASINILIYVIKVLSFWSMPSRKIIIQDFKFRASLSAMMRRNRCTVLTGKDRFRRQFSLRYKSCLLSWLARVELGGRFQLGKNMFVCLSGKDRNRWHLSIR